MLQLFAPEACAHSRKSPVWKYIEIFCDSGYDLMKQYF